MKTLNRENIDFELFLKEKIAINCQTEEDCIDFLKMCDEVGIKWGSGSRASSVTYFDSYGKDTCYSYVNSKGDSGLCSGSFGFHSRKIGLRIYKWQTLNNDNKEITDDKDKKEMINHPSHYNQGIEVIDIIESWGLNFSLGNAIKYILRAPHKSNQIEDLKKASWYIKREIEFLEKSCKEDETIVS